MYFFVVSPEYTVLTDGGGLLDDADSYPSDIRKIRVSLGALKKKLQSMIGIVLWRRRKINAVRAGGSNSVLGLDVCSE